MANGDKKNGGQNYVEVRKNEHRPYKVQKTINEGQSFTSWIQPNQKNEETGKYELSDKQKTQMEEKSVINIMKENPEMSPEQANFLARDLGGYHFAVEDSIQNHQGRYQDPEFQRLYNEGIEGLDEGDRIFGRHDIISRLEDKNVQPYGEMDIKNIAMGEMEGRFNISHGDENELKKLQGENYQYKEELARKHMEQGGGILPHDEIKDKESFMNPGQSELEEYHQNQKELLERGGVPLTPQERMQKLRDEHFGESGSFNDRFKKKRDNLFNNK